ncbi:MAG: hypothetical protein ABH954_05165 [Candidatus Omnitrophota bacterium]
MQYFLYSVALLWAVFGMGLMLLPERVCKFYERFGKIKNMKPFSAISIAFGLLFFLSMDDLRVGSFGYAMGLMAIFKGFYLLIIKEKQVKEIMDWWLKGPVPMLRMWGMFLMALALILVSIIK